MTRTSAAVAEYLPEAAELALLQTHVQTAARLLKLLASDQRLLILCRLAEGESSVGELTRYVGLAQSAVSQHLAKLRAEGVVATRRDGQTIFYSLVDPAAARLIETLCGVFRGNPAA